ncbi:tyrosine-type recombinase/integrase [Hymenobacter canadensis]|uniref:Tyr recombinase domain-containing protein n=1 Tax=Hymenobacter canadensis TaxID=2999067 RepID=A0ABY7LRY4_9BACT|nr:tyrosine-type recombinase/integrase [Hymenobacter canadensis]WBA43183.1 hypothetical protein O3303_06360 [Hymenobacter canadensis]
MATIKPFIRNVNKNKVEQPLSVQWQHRGSKWVISTGLTVDPDNFIGGRALGKDAPRINAKLNEVISSLRAAQAQLTSFGIDLTVEAMKEAYEKAKEAFAPDHERTLTGIFERFIDMRRYSYSRSQVKILTCLNTCLHEYNPKLDVRLVDEAEMYRIQGFLIQRGLTNTSIQTYMTKVLMVLNCFAEELNLDGHFKRYKFNLPRRDDNVIYFERHEFEELVNLPLQKKAHLKIRDTLVLMCVTGLRYSDVFFNPATSIIGDEIVVVTQKTKQRLVIPITPIARQIIDRGLVKKCNYQYYRLIIRRITAMMPSLQYHETIVRFNGQNPVTTYKPKHELITAHTGRRTFINLCLEAGLPISKISAITGHKTLESFSIYADRKRNLAEQLAKVTIFG